MILTPTAYLNTLDFMSDHTRQIKQMIRHLSNLLELTHFVMAHVEKKNKLRCDTTAEMLDLYPLLNKETFI